MPVMSRVEATFCRSAPWGWFARRVVLPWALDGFALEGEVLEIGGGSGAMARGVGTAFPDARLTVTDPDSAMVAAAGRRLAGLPGVRVQAADVTALPFEDDSFDAVTSYLMLHHVVGWEAAVREVARVLRPGGVLVGYDLTDTALARAVHRADGSPHRLVSPLELRGALEEAGFEVSQISLSAAGHLMRFHARMPQAGPPAPVTEIG